MAQHMVLKKGRYWELQESYRDDRGRPRKRFVRYLGVLGHIDWKATFAPGDGIDWHAIEQQQLARVKEQEDAHAQKLKEQREAFKAATGLELPVGPVDPVPVEHAHAQPSVPEPSAPEVSQSEQPSEAAADANGTATPSDAVPDK